MIPHPGEGNNPVDHLLKQFFDGEKLPTKYLKQPAIDYLKQRARFYFSIKAPGVDSRNHYWFAFTIKDAWMTTHRSGYDDCPAFDFYVLPYTPALAKEIAVVTNKKAAKYQIAIDKQYAQEEEQSAERLMTWAKNNPSEAAGVMGFDEYYNR